MSMSSRCLVLKKKNKGKSVFQFSHNMADGNANLTPTKEEPKKQKRNQNKNYAVKKRPPIKPVEGDNVIFVNRKTNFKVNP